MAQHLLTISFIGNAAGDDISLKKMPEATNILALIQEPSSALHSYF